MNSLNQVINQWEKLGKPRGLRLGQFFVLAYFKGSYPILFYEENNAIAQIDIAEWLEDNCYTDTLPDMNNEFKEAVEGGNDAV